jgi:hypothetical protein
VPLRPSTKTFNDLLQEVKRLFGDEAGVQLDNTDIQRWADAAQQEIVNQNKALKAKSTLPTVIGTSTYDFPAIKIQQIEALHYDNMRLENVPFAEAERVIISQDPEQIQSGTPAFWYEWDGEISLWPKPDAVKDLTLYYTAYPEPLTGITTDFLGVPDKFYNAIVDYVLSKCYEMDEDMQASQMAEARFRAALESQMEDERQAQNMTYPVIIDTWSQGYY